MILVVGSGGNAQTYFMEFLKNNNVHINDSRDKDGLKHIPNPNSIKKNVPSSISKCIFLYNDPCKAILSFFTKKWQWNQIKKLSNPHSLTKENVKDLNTFSVLLKKENKDLFGIEYQFENWINNELGIPVYFLDFNRVLKEKDILDTFVDKKLDYGKFSNMSFIRYLRLKHSDMDNSVRNIYQELYKSITSKSDIYNKHLNDTEN